MNIQKIFQEIRNFIERLLISIIPSSHQRSHATRYDRYPKIFNGVKECIGEGGEATILSFGCSKGEETASLAKYFPESRIIGADISSYVLRIARWRCRSFRNVQFINSHKNDIAAHGPFEVIFAMSVLCRAKETRDLENCSEVYPFSRFEEACENLVKNLKPGGILVIFNSNYRFTDTRFSNMFQPLSLPGVKKSGFVTKFDKQGNRLENQPYKYVAYQKGDHS